MLNASSTLLSGTRQTPLVHPTDYGHLESRFLQGLTPAVRHAVLSAAIQRRVPAHTILTNQEDPAQYFFLLLSGLARHFFTSYDGSKQLLLWLRPGDIVGGMALLPTRALYLVSTELLSKGVVAVWERQDIRRLMSEYPILLENSVVIASDYLTWYVASHNALRCRDARQRLFHVLTSLASGLGRETPEGIELDVTNEELANTAGVSYFTVSRFLSQWQRKGVVSKKRGKLLIRDLTRM